MPSRGRFLGMRVDVPRKCCRLRRCSLLSIWFDSAGTRDGFRRHLHRRLDHIRRIVSPSFWSELTLSGDRPSREMTAPSRSGGHQAHRRQRLRRVATGVAVMCCGVLCCRRRRLWCCHWHRLHRNIERRCGTGDGRRRTDRLSRRTRVHHRGRLTFRRRTRRGIGPTNSADGRVCAIFGAACQHDGNGRHRTYKFNGGRSCTTFGAAVRTRGTTGIGPTNRQREQPCHFRGHRKRY